MVDITYHGDGVGIIKQAADQRGEAQEQVLRVYEAMAAQKQRDELLRESVEICGAICTAISRGDTVQSFPIRAWLDRARAQGFEVK